MYYNNKVFNIHKMRNDFLSFKNRFSVARYNYMTVTFDNEMAFFIRKKNRHGVVSMTGTKLIWKLCTRELEYENFSSQ